jgi:hypothetical protein
MVVKNDMACPFCISCHVDVCSDKLVLFSKLDIDIFFGDIFFVKLIMTTANFWSSSFSINNLGNKKFGD